MPVELVTRGGQMLVEKSSVHRPQRIRHEADLLAAFRHPGAVELVSAPTDEAAPLVTAYAGPLTLASCPPMPVLAAGTTIAALAATVADLHDAGFVHRRLSPDHVIVGPSGTPILCGFGDAGPATTAEELADDVAAIGRLLDHVLAGDGFDAMEPIPDCRWPGWRSSARTVAGERRALLALADHATADDPALRPAARDLAEAISALVHPPRRAHRATAPAAAAAVAGLALLAFGAAALRAPSATVTPDASPPAAPPARPPAAAAQIDDRTITVGDRQWEAGVPGDRAVVGDWDCDGTETPALLRPTTGEVFVFPSWTGPRGEVEVTALTTIDGATRIRAEKSAAGCARLVVDRDGGPPIEVVG